MTQRMLAPTPDHHHSPEGPTSTRRWTTLLASAVTLTSLAVYLLTLVREVDWGDSAELALQAFQLGVTHPPGYPVSCRILLSPPTFSARSAPA